MRFRNDADKHLESVYFFLLSNLIKWNLVLEFFPLLDALKSVNYVACCAC